MSFILRKSFVITVQAFHCNIIHELSSYQFCDFTSCHLTLITMSSYSHPMHLNYQRNVWIMKKCIQLACPFCQRMRSKNMLMSFSQINPRDNHPFMTFCHWILFLTKHRPQLNPCGIDPNLVPMWCPYNHEVQLRLKNH